MSISRSFSISSVMVFQNVCIFGISSTISQFLQHLFVELFLKTQAVSRVQKNLILTFHSTQHLKHMVCPASSSTIVFCSSSHCPLICRVIWHVSSISFLYIWDIFFSLLMQGVERKLFFKQAFKQYKHSIVNVLSQECSCHRPLSSGSITTQLQLCSRPLFFWTNRPFLQQTFKTCHSRKSTDVINAFHLGCIYCAWWLTGMPYWDTSMKQSHH